MYKPIYGIFKNESKLNQGNALLLGTFFWDIDRIKFYA